MQPLKATNVATQTASIYTSIKAPVLEHYKM